MKTLLILLFLFVGACGEKFSDGSGGDELVEQKDNSPVMIEVVEGNEVGKYGVHFLSRNGKSFSVIKHDLLNDEITEVAVNVEKEFMDEDVVSGETYKYEVGEYTENKSFKQFVVKEIKIPLDIRIVPDEKLKVEEFDLSQTSEGQLFIEVNRLLFTANSTLFTNGKPIHIKVNKLFSRGGTISSHPEGSKAESGQHGLGGGSIYVEALYAKGDPRLVLRGQNGGDGLRPAPLGLEEKGVDSKKVGSTGLAERDIYQPLFGKEEVKGEYCKVNPGQGGTGGRGKKGLKGGTGGNGGNSGRASISILEPDSFEVSYEFIPGIEGQGSIGGEGGPGGDGGPSGGENVKEYIEDEDLQGTKLYESFNKIPQICRSNPGLRGPKGETGDYGEKGQPGANEIICIKIGNENQTQCFKQNKKGETND